MEQSGYLKRKNISGLSQNTTYFYAQAIIDIPTVINFTPFAITKNTQEIDIFWNILPGNTYTVYGSANNPLIPSLNNILINNTNTSMFANTALYPNTSYYYIVYATTQNLTTFSAQVSAKTYSSVMVTGAGTSAFNGAYIPGGVSFGMPYIPGSNLYYLNSNYYLRFTGINWELHSNITGPDFIYYQNNTTTLSGNWVSTIGTNPIPYLFYQ